MDQGQMLIKEAKIFLQGTDAAQHERGKELLRRVITENEGTETARQAHELLGRHETPPVPPLDLELNRLEMEWASLQGLSDHRLPTFLRKLEGDAGRAAQLRPKVVGQLRKWMAEALPRVTTNVAETELAPLNNFLATVQGMPVYEELNEFGHLRKALFRRRFQAAAAHLHEALQQWALEEAWKQLNGLRPAPEEFKAELEQLQAEVYQTAQLQQAVQEWLRKFSAAGLGATAETNASGWGENWLSVRLLGEALQSLPPFLDNGQVPDEWRAQLMAADEQGRTALREALQHHAQTALHLADLRKFQFEYDRLPSVAQLSVSAEWFETVLEDMTNRTQSEMERARDAAALMALGNRWRNETAGVPAPVTERMGDLIEEVNQCAVAWKAMIKGEGFTPFAARRLALPAAYLTAQPRYEEWLKQIEQVQVALRNPASLLAAADLSEARELAEEILEKVPEHFLARRLLAETKRRLAFYQLDEALLRWDVADFVRLYEIGEPDEFYGGLVESEVELQTLAELAHQPGFLSSHEAAGWWAAWRQALRQLTADHRPEALREAIATQERLRREQWYASLQVLLQEELAPQQYLDEAATLEAEENDPQLQFYRNAFTHRAIVGWVKHHLKHGEFAAAEDELNRLAPSHPDAQRLRMQLQVAQTRALGVTANQSLAELLWSHWHEVQAYVEEPYALLREALQQAWEVDDEASLSKVRQVLARVRNSQEVPSSEASAQLAEWEAWLVLEEKLLTNSWPHYLQDLAAQLKKRDDISLELLQQRLAKLSRSWRQQGNTLLLAWAQQAFQRIDPALSAQPDAAEQMRAESVALAAELVAELAQRADLGLDAMKQWQTRLNAEAGRWNDLNDYLALLPHTVKRKAMPKKFQLAKEKLNHVFTLCQEIERLKETDLRVEVERLATVRLQLRELHDVALREPLQQTLERLTPLAGIGFLELRMREAAEACGSTVPKDIHEQGHFAQLAKTLNQLIESFVQAGVENATMWHQVSLEYDELIHETAGLLTARMEPPNLRRLVTLLKALEEEDDVFKHALDRLNDPEARPSVPEGGRFDPERHLSYLNLIPRDAPRTRKTYRRFDRFAQRKEMKSMLEQSRPYLPHWVRQYLPILD